MAIAVPVYHFSLAEVWHSFEEDDPPVPLIIDD
jgi:hypothetical protein